MSKAENVRTNAGINQRCTVECSSREPRRKFPRTPNPRPRAPQIPDEFAPAIRRLTEEELSGKQVRLAGNVFHVVSAVLVLCQMLGESARRREDPAARDSTAKRPLQCSAPRAVGY